MIQVTRNYVKEWNGSVKKYVNLFKFDIKFCYDECLFTLTYWPNSFPKILTYAENIFYFQFHSVTFSNLKTFCTVYSNKLQLSSQIQLLAMKMWKIRERNSIYRRNVWNATVISAIYDKFQNNNLYFTLSSKYFFLKKPKTSICSHHETFFFVMELQYNISF